MTQTTLPIAVVISIRVKKGYEQDFELLTSKIVKKASFFSGHMGATLLSPSNLDDSEYRIILKFNTQKNLDNWLNSSERLEFVTQIDNLLEKPSDISIQSSLVTCFSTGYNPVKPPPKYKMTIVGWLALFPTVTIILWLFGEQLAQLPLLISTFIITLVVIILMYYLLMPNFTRWFAFWLFDKDGKNIS